jgi:hypothetical protein
MFNICLSGDIIIFYLFAKGSGSGDYIIFVLLLLDMSLESLATAATAVAV